MIVVMIATMNFLGDVDNSSDWPTLASPPCGCAILRASSPSSLRRPEICHHAVMSQTVTSIGP